jgi:hypothetical protein
MGTFDDFMIEQAVKKDREADQQHDKIRKLTEALRFIKDLSGECMDNGDVRVGTAAEVAMRHIWRRADETLS